MLEERAARWKDEYIRQGVLIGEARGKAIGEAIGETRGKAIGKAIGEARGIRIALLDFLENRFGEVPQSVTAFLEATSDADMLRRLMQAAYRAESLQAFSEVIRKEQQ